MNTSLQMLNSNINQLITLLSHSLDITHDPVSTR